MAALIGFAASVILGGISGSNAKKQAKKARNLEIARIRMQTAEEIRRRTGAFEHTKSEGLAAAGASGFGSRADGQRAESGGFAQMLQGMQEEFELEIDWLNKSAAAGIDATGQAYKNTVSTIDYTTAGSLVSSFNTLGQAKNWWT